MEFKLVSSIVSNIQQTIVNSLAGTANTLKGHTFNVRVKNFNKTQLVKGTITVANQKRLEKEIKDSRKVQNSILGFLNSMKFPTSIRVDNFPDYPKFPEFPKSINVDNFPKPQEFPKNIRVSNQPTKELDSIANALKDVNGSVKKIKFNPTINVEAPKLPNINVPEPRVTVTQKDIDYERLASLIPQPEQIDYTKLAESIAKEIGQSIVTLGGGGTSGNKYPYRTSNGQPSHAVVNDLGQISNVSEERWGVNNTYEETGLSYIGEQDVDGNWILRKVVEADGSTTITYATVNNNPGYTDYTSAWTDRLSLVYDIYQVAFTA